MCYRRMDLNRSEKGSTFPKPRSNQSVIAGLNRMGSLIQYYQYRSYTLDRSNV
jgi:hypothetical protein